jgi:hypothetical protein
MQNNIIKLGKIDEVKLREIWKNEADDFTPWLAQQENLDILGEGLGLNLIEAEKEVPVGSFYCDIKCKIENDNRIAAIENQIEDSNHDHLGKSIVYASGIGASIVIWIVKNARPEHASAIEWLNEHSDSNIGFFLLEIHAVKIGNSAPAPQFKVIAQPNEYVKSAKGNEKKELTGTQIGRYDFWSQMNKYIDANNIKLNVRKPSYDHWYNFSIGSSKYHLSVNLLDYKNKIRVELWISDNKDIYDELFENKEKIEEILGKLEWDRKDNAKASSIADYINDFSFDNRDNWESLFKQICDKVIDFSKVLKNYLK